MNNLILFTMRSGSTVLADILSYAHNTLNLGEGLFSSIRPYNYNAPQNKTTDLYYQFANTHVAESYYIGRRSQWPDHRGFFNAKQGRIDLLKQTQQSWTAKDLLDKMYFDISFVEYCINNGVQIYMTHRRDIAGQLKSIVNGRYRFFHERIVTLDDHLTRTPTFIYTNQSPIINYNEIRVSYELLRGCTALLEHQLFLWRIIYDKFKPHIKLVSYEDVIKPMNFTSLGISNNVVESYKNEPVRLVPTPNNTDNILVIDEFDTEMPGVWNEAVYLMERHKHLVEV